MNDFYGLESWRTWNTEHSYDLSTTKTSSCRDWSDNEQLEVTSYRDLVKVVAFLNVMNNHCNLAFRGQATDEEPVPTLLRSVWGRPNHRRQFDIGTRREDHYWPTLETVCSRVATVILRQNPPRHRPFETFARHRERRVAPWAVVQHYELWPTPLLDLTTSLRIAASFALGLSGRRSSGFLYVFAVPRPESDVMELGTRSRFVALRLSAVCPPDVPRPHLQEGLLVGNPQFELVDVSRPSSLKRRLVAKFRLVDSAGPTGTTEFWDRDFPKHTARSLLPGGAIRDELICAMNYRVVDGHLALS